jgi:hypothetical protein
MGLRYLNILFEIWGLFVPLKREVSRYLTHTFSPAQGLTLHYQTTFL